MKLVPLASLAFALPVSAAPQVLELVEDFNAEVVPISFVDYLLPELDGWRYVAREAPGVGNELHRVNAATGEVQLVADLAPGVAGSRPDLVTRLGDRILFVADDTIHGFELWSTDGTPGGTQLVKDVHPGVGHGIVPQYWTRAPLTVADGRVFFAGRDSASNIRLWCSDGTAAGTVKVSDEGFSGPSKTTGFAVLGDSVYYRASSGLWRGSATEVELVTSVSGGPNDIEVMGGTLFFHAQDESGYELWSSDGSAAGTQRLVDVQPGPGSSYPSLLTAIGSQLFFSANDGTHGRELWVSDGTAAGTQMVKDVNPGPDSALADSIYRSLCEFGGRAYFAADSGSGWTLWTSDGTEAGTAQVLGGAGTPTLEPLGALPEEPVGGPRLFFAGTRPGEGRELWVTDGSGAGTTLVSDLLPGTVGSWPRSFAHDDVGSVWFLADAPGGTSLVESDGTATGTTVRADGATSLLPVTGSSDPKGLVDHFGRVFGGAEPGGIGIEPFVADVSGVDLIGDLAPGPAHAFLNDDIEFLFPVAPRWGAFGADLLFFVRDGLSALDLHRTDGTPGTTEILGSFSQVGGASSFSYIDPFAGVELPTGFVFGAATIADGHGIYVTDGTSAGTVRIGFLSNMARYFVRVGNQAYFMTDRTFFGQVTPERLWVTDGTSSGTRIVRNFADEEIDGPTMTALGERIVFVADSPSSGAELWFSEGLGGTTGQWVDLQPGPIGSEPEELVTVRDRLYFVADDGQVGREVWWTDAALAGPTLLAELGPGSTGPEDLTAVGERLFFVVGNEVFVEGGAGPVSAGSLPASSSAYSLTAGGSRRVFFGAFDSEFGTELWTSDGTASGTELVTDFHIGTSYANPDWLTLSGGRLFVRTEDTIKGEELYSMPLGAVAQSVGVGCTGGGQLPRLSAEDPVLGGTTTFRVRGARPFAPLVAFLGDPSLPLPLGAGCSAYVAPATATSLLTGATDGTGTFESAALGVPSAGVLAGVELGVQALLGPFGDGPFAGFDLTDGVRLVLGA